MRKIRLKYPTQKIFGTRYEVNLHRSHKEEDLIVPQPPNLSPPSGEPSDAQRIQRQRFAFAAAYATAALADPQVRAQYEVMAQQRGKRLRGAALSDYLKGNNLLSKN